MHKARTALILIDLENEWRTKGSAYYLGDLSAYIRRVNKLIGIARRRGYRVIFVRHTEPGSKKEFRDGTPRTELFPELDRRPEDSVVSKTTIGSFYRTCMDSALVGIDTVVVAGVLTNLCVRSFVADAYDREFSITLVKDCCVARDRKTHDFTLKDLKNTRDELCIVSLATIAK